MTPFGVATPGWKPLHYTTTVFQEQHNVEMNESIKKNAPSLLIGPQRG